MRCPTLIRSLSIVLTLAAGVAMAAPGHHPLSPVPGEAVRAVRAAQQGREDALANTLARRLRETHALVRDMESGDGDLPQRRGAAAAKRQEIAGLRDEVLQRVAGAAQAAAARGDARGAAEANDLKRRLAERFALLTEDLVALEKADRSGMRQRARQTAGRIDAWLAARPVETLPRPNWRRAEPLLPLELPSTRALPRFVTDASWLMQEKLASRDGFIRVALRATPTEATACGYSAADLADSAEAPKLHPDIVALAAQLDHNPVRMFEWVNQNIKFEPYYGSMKGGLGALWSQSGGATDQASLMIALLRAANIPARYVRGNISVLDGSALGAEGRGPRWTGAKSYLAAANILGNNGNPATAYRSNGIDLAHVWVEACLPYAAWRGAGIDDSGHRWVPLDPSFKDHRYQAGIQVDPAFDFNYGNWLASRLDAQGNYKLPQEAFEDEVATHVKTKAPHYANNTIEDVPYQSEIKRRHYDILPIVPPYEVRQYTSWSGVANESAETAALPERHKYRLQVVAKTAADSVLAQKTLDLAELASKRLTLSFKGATAGDQSAFDAWFNAVDPAVNPACAATANMVPSIKLEGVEQASEAGSGTTPLCSTNNQLTLTVTLAELGTYATRNNVTYGNIGAANLHALHAYAWHTSDAYLAKRSELLLANVRANGGNPNADRDGIEGEFLNIAASKYSRYVADASKRAGELFGESGTVGVGLGLTSAQVKVNYLFDLPYGLFRKGFLVDWPGAIYTGTRIDGTSGDRRAFKLSGFASSAYEAYIWNELAGLDAVSTTRGLQFADEQNIEILQINNASDWAAQKSKLTSNADSTLDYSPTHVTQIETDYVNKGFKLTIPRSLIRYPDSTGWKGAAFYAENLALGSLGFPISGYSGGITVEPSGSATSGTEGEASGGYSQGDPFAGLYNPALGTGIVADPYATAVAQQSGINGYQTSLGYGSGTSVSGDPVNMVTGNLIHSERDIAIKGRGGLPLVFERWYNSQGAQDGPLGYGWTHSFNHSLRFYGVESGVAKLAWVDGTGGERFFATANHVSGNIAVGATLSGTAGVYATLERLADGSYRITERSGMKYVFESINGTATDTGLRARLLSITDRNNNALTLAYGAACGNNLCTVTDGLGRALTFTYNGTHIASIGDWSGRQWQYQYDANGDLISFKNPLAVAGSQPPVAYQYHTSVDGAKLAHALKRYTLPRGNGMAFEYYANGRVFRHTPFGTDGSLKEDHATTFAWSEFRREARQIDGLGNARTFLFDKHGNPLSITDEAGARSSYSYDTAAGRTHLRLSKTAPNGQTMNYAYDSLGNLTDVTLPSGRTLQYRDHTAYGLPRRVKDGNNNWTLNRYDAAGNLTDVIQTRAGVIPVADSRPASADILAWSQFQADSVGNPILVRRLRDWTTAALGNPTSGVGPSLETAFDANKLNVVSLTRRGDTNGTPASLETDTYSDFQWDSLGRPTRGPDAAWYPADRQYDALDRAIKTPDGRGNTWATVFDPNGNPVNVGLTVGGAYLDGHYATWDDLDRLERKVDYAGNAVLNDHDALGRVSAVTGPDGYRVGFDRDPMGRITSAYDEEGHRVSLSLDPDGRPRSSTDPNGLTTAYAYHDSTQDGRLKRTTLPKVTGQSSGRAIEIAAYDGAGRPTRIDAIAADGSIRDSYRFYDELGRVTRSVGPQVSSTDSNRPVTCVVYTALGDVAEIWAGGTTDTASKTCTLDGVAVKKQLTRTYDDFGRKLTETDALGKVWRWAWNGHGELVSSQTPVQAAAGQSTTYAYGTKGAGGETQGQLKSRTVPGAQTVAYIRNALGQVTKAETKDGTGALVVAYDYAYDPAKRLKSVTDSRGGKQLSYTWTPGGRLAQVQDTDGHLASYAYDAAGRLVSIAAPNGETIAFVYDAGGRLVERRLNSGQRTTQSWFEDGSLKEKKNLYGATVLSSHLYTIDAQGRRSGQTENVGGSVKTWSYQYDYLDRLTSASDGTAETYSYDGFGNPRAKTKSDTTTAYLYDAAHQLSEIRSGSDTGALVGAAVHDADGHLTKLCEVSIGGTVTKTTSDCTASGTGATTLALAWNALDHLLSATRTGANAVAETYAYDDGGRRIAKVGAGGTAHYLYDGDDIHAEWATAMAGMPTAIYAHGAGADEPILRLTGSTNGPAATQAAYLQDGLGSAIAMANTAGTITANQRFDAWGNKTAGSGTVPQYGYTGREPDATGLAFYRARYYHAGIGRFLSRDPAGMADAVSPYAYVANSPTNFTDPSGEFIPLSAAGAIWGGISGVISGGISGYMTAGPNADFWSSVKSASIGAAVGGAVGAAAGAALQPQIASVLAVQAVSGVLGTVASNPATTAITQAVNNQPVRPMENFTMKDLSPGFVASVAGPAAVGVARMGASLVNATSAGVQSVTGASGASLIGIEGQAFGRATDVLSGTVNGLVTGALGASQPAAPYAATGSGSGTQNLQSFSELAVPSSGWTFGAGAPSSYYGAAPAPAK
jgi:RHS repeat-associated protein